MHGFQLQDLAAERLRELRADAATARRAHEVRRAAARRRSPDLGFTHADSPGALPGANTTSPRQRPRQYELRDAGGPGTRAA